MKEKLIYTINNKDYMLIQFEVPFYYFDEINEKILNIGGVLNSQNEIDKRGFLKDKTYLLKYLIPFKNINKYNYIIKRYI